MRTTRTISRRLAATFAASALVLAACGADDTTDTTTEPPVEDDGLDDDGLDDDGLEDDGLEDEGVDDDGLDDDADTGMDDDGDAAADLTAANLGAACAELPADGPGSAADMADQSVATAAAGNPLLSTLVGLVAQAGLVDTLDDLEAATVFAPTDDAFAALQTENPELFETVANDPEVLATVLTYHVVEGEELNAQDLLDAGSTTTVAGQDVTVVEGGVEGIQLEAAGGTTADVICGNVQTANATVHVIDTVLLPDVG